MLTLDEIMRIMDMSPPRLSKQVLEDYCVDIYINPYAPWMKIDYERVEKRIKAKKSYKIEGNVIFLKMT